MSDTEELDYEYTDPDDDSVETEENGTPSAGSLSQSCSSTKKNVNHKNSNALADETSSANNAESKDIVGITSVASNLPCSSSQDLLHNLQSEFSSISVSTLPTITSTSPDNAGATSPIIRTIKSNDSNVDAPCISSSKVLHVNSKYLHTSDKSYTLCSPAAGTSSSNCEKACVSNMALPSIDSNFNKARPTRKKFTPSSKKNRGRIAKPEPSKGRLLASVFRYTV